MIRLCLAAVLWTTIALSASAQNPAMEVDALMTAYHETGQFDGSVLIASGDAVVYEKGFGQANQSWEAPNAPDTRHRIASVTKQFTAALVMQLVESGDLALDAPITRYLPDYPAAQGDNVTLHHLLSHTSGIPEHTGRDDFDDMMRDPITPTAFLDVFSGEPLDFEPGSEYTYSNSGYVLLGALIEAVTGQSYADALRTRIAEPLSLTDTQVQTNEAVLDRMASGYNRVGSGFQNAVYLDTSVPYAAGMIVSTVRDLHRWTRALHAAEPFDDDATLARMLTPVLNDYAYGVGVATLPVGDGTVRAIAHAGGIPGFSSWLVYFPETEQTLAIVSNTGDGTGAIMRALAQVMHGEAVAMPTTPITTVLTDVLQTDGVDAAIARYREMRAAGGEFGENQLNTLGYQLLAADDIPGAIQIFELNVEMYPDASNPYDSLGEAYFEARDPEKSAANYLRSLELDPTNDNARDMLERIGVAVPDAVEVAVSSDALDAYVGTYALAPGMTLEITREGDTLYGAPTGQSRAELSPVSGTRFRAASVGAEVTFTRTGDAPASSLTLHRGGRDTLAERVE